LTVADANGAGDLTWTVQDSGGTANGGVDTLTETLAITVNAVDGEGESSAPAAMDAALLAYLADGDDPLAIPEMNWEAAVDQAMAQLG
jgi:hypothetical protein